MGTGKYLKEKGAGLAEIIAENFTWKNQSKDNSP